MADNIFNGLLGTGPGSLGSYVGGNFAGSGGYGGNFGGGCGPVGVNPYANTGGYQNYLGPQQGMLNQYAAQQQAALGQLAALQAQQLQNVEWPDPYQIEQDKRERFLAQRRGLGGVPSPVTPAVVGAGGEADGDRFTHLELGEDPVIEISEGPSGPGLLEL